MGQSSARDTALLMPFHLHHERISKIGQFFESMHQESSKVAALLDTSPQEQSTTQSPSHDESQESNSAYESENTTSATTLNPSSLISITADGSCIAMSFGIYFTILKRPLSTDGTSYYTVAGVASGCEGHEEISAITVLPTMINTSRNTTDVKLFVLVGYTSGALRLYDEVFPQRIPSFLSCVCFSLYWFTFTSQRQPNSQDM